mmetsp:Transcript_52318/g.113392  ORF Transcript_52318/g.113392 Transcript_52318/m.113392 type:complete len:491 (+) Transcript_52318:117-1589(+)
MGSVASQLWEKDPPEVKEGLENLKGWQREDLRIAFERFRALACLTVNISSFMQLLNFEERHKAEAVFNYFKPKKGRIDFLTVMGPMVVMSDQHLISRAAFLFSLYDFNGSGGVNRAELFIAIRTIFRGLSCFCSNVEDQNLEELEQVTLELFLRVDDDKSDVVLIGEFMTFVYRSRSYRFLVAPFPSKDGRVFEEQVHFAWTAPKLVKVAGKVEQSLEKKLKHRIRITPDEPETSCGVRSRRRLKRSRPWKDPNSMNKAHAWMAWKVFFHLAGEEHGKTRLIPKEDLRPAIGPQPGLMSVLHSVLGIQGDDEDPGTNPERPDDVLRILPNFSKLLGDENIRTRLDEICEEGVSFRAFCCLLWPSARESEIEVCVGWCNAFQAQKVLRELIANGEHGELDLDPHDINVLFEVIDANGDGQLSVEELCKIGHIGLTQARTFVDRWDEDNTGSLSKGDVMNIIFSIDAALKYQLKGLFAASQMRRPDEPVKAA